MIADLDVMLAIATNRKPVAGARGVAELLDVDSDSDLAGQLARLVNDDELLERYVLGTGYFYNLTAKGREYLAANDVDLAKLPPPKRKQQQPVRESAPQPIPVATRTPPIRLGGEEAQKSVRRIHRADVAAAKDDQEGEVPMTTKVQQSERRELLAKIIDKAGSSWHAAKDLAKATDVPSSVARKLLGQLVAAKRIQSHGETSNKRYGKLGLTVGADANTAAAKATPKRKAKGAKKSRKAKSQSRPGPLKPSPALIAGVEVDAGNDTVASFTAKGEIVVSAPRGVKHLNVDESREVIGLVRAFDQAGLLPKAA